MYRIMWPMVVFLMNLVYRPTIINDAVIPKNGGCILCGNHKHYFDPLLVDISTTRTVYALCNAKYYQPYEWFFKSVGSIPVVMKNGHAALESAIDHINQGKLINISPEGTRNKTNGILLPFKTGSVRIAQATGCKIIPYSITGDYKFFSRNLVLHYGEPIDVSNMTVEEANQLLYDTVKSMMQQHGDTREDLNKKA